MPTLYTHSDANKRKTWFLLSGFIIFIIIVGYVFSVAMESQGVLYFAVILSILMSFFSYWFSDKIVLAMSDAKKVEFESNKELYKILTHTPWIIKEVNEYFYNSIISHLAIIRRRILFLNKEGIVKTTDFYTVFYGIFGFIDGVMQKWFKRNCDYSLKEELPVIIEVLFYGFVGDKMRREEFVYDDNEIGVYRSTASIEGPVDGPFSKEGIK